MIQNEQSIKNNLLHRASLRGIKKCTSCGFINGQRALICRNVSCNLRIKRLAAIKPFDPIQLVTYGHIKLYSLRSKEKLLQPRNFVSITEFQESIYSRPCAICYVDNCKYDSSEPTHLVCRHIKACKVLTDVAVAEIYPIDKNILWNLNISVKQKQYLWELYKKEENFIHPVQKLNPSTFVVKCEASSSFPTGRLHITIFNKKISSKIGNFACSCKKLKIFLEPDNSVIMRQEICDHLLLLLAAILSKREGKQLYGKFLNLLQYLWMPTSLNTPLVDCGSRSPQLIDYDRSSDNCNKQTFNTENTEVPDNSNDVFNFTEDLFAENNIPDFCDIILEDKTLNFQNMDKRNRAVKTEMRVKDAKLNASPCRLTDEEINLNFQHFKSPPLSLTSLEESISQTPLNFSEDGLSVIEQFQLNHNLRVSNDNIELAKDIECLNNMESNIMEKSTITPLCVSKQKSLLKSSFAINTATENSTEKPNVNSIKNVPAVKIYQKSTVFKQCPVKIIKIATPVKLLPVRQIPQIVKISKISANKIVLKKTKQCDDFIEKDTKHLTILHPASSRLCPTEDEETSSVSLPSLSYETWLDHIIEVLNTCVAIQDSPSIEKSFHVPESFFNHLSKTFVSSNKRKLPINTDVITSENYKNQIKYTWCFNQVSLVQRIFSSKNMEIEMERLYHRLPSGNYELFIPKKVKLTDKINFRTIYPKVQLYKAFIQFSNNPESNSHNIHTNKCSFRLEWLPEAFPKSNFGLMTIKFSVSVKESDGI